MSHSIPGPRGLPLLGNLHQFMRDPLAFLTGLGRDYGDITTFRIGQTSNVFINHPDYIDQLVRTHTAHRSPVVRGAMRSFLGEGVLSLEGGAHLRRRRLMQPAFTKERLRAYADLMFQESEAATDRWADGQVHDLRKTMMELTLGIVGGALFSADTFHHARTVDANMRRVLGPVTTHFRISRMFRRALPIWYMPSTQRAIGELQGLVRQLVAERRRSSLKPADLMSMLIAAQDEDGSGLSDEDVAAELLTLLLAGHETTANTLTWTFYALQRHPRWVQALQSELSRVAPGRTLRFDDLHRLELCERVVKEALRMYPPAWFGDRVPAEPMRFGDHTVPGGVPVWYSVYVTHRDARFFADPERFDPDRFLPERFKQVPPGAYLPFGAGVHVCIGSAFALLEAKIILASILRKLSVLPAGKASGEPKPLVTLEMAHPFPVRFVRNGSQAFVDAR